MNAPLIALNNGTAIPQIGLGTWPLDDDQVEQAIITAAELGYRHVDTAAKYGNETGVGRGIRSCGVPREEMFVTTKLDGGYQGDDRAIAGLDACLERMGLDYVDLLLIHWPLPQRDLFVSTWRTFEKLHEQGKARAIGVSNFKPDHLKTLMAQTGIVPAVNQIQLSPRIPRLDHRVFHGQHGIVTEAYSPLGAGSDLLENPSLRQIGQEYGKTPAQVVVRWHVQNGFVVIPKSKNSERMAQNLDVFDFELSRNDLLALDLLSAGNEHGVDADVDGH
ncbi:aldo/keto reductase [Microbacterium sp. STN6]|uniref:aldo/keto reductase n=1 Tax=Microbacterium sp. STN6 TaxID=2995588 RepID=UPI002260DADC|nr:aldo/keto reductase [Microbacterium sp. STN6]MCX7522611.1 aldo/keto reductase [Microbacterium sp. STN6]